MRRATAALARARYPSVVLRRRWASSLLFASLSPLLASLLTVGCPPSSARGQDASAGEPGPVVDATLEAMRAGRVSLRDHRGRRVVVLFYEDRPHVEDNDTLKGELVRFIADNGLAERLVAYGVANLGDLGAVPRALVRSMIAPLVERWGADILLDWDGVMRRPPFSFATHAANTAILDRDGRLVWRHVGRIDEARRRDFYRALRAALR